MSAPPTTTVTCLLDQAEVHYLPAYLQENHNLSVEEYLEQFPGAPLESEALQKAYSAKVKKVPKVKCPDLSELTVSVGNFEFAVNIDVPEEACLPMPENYHLPTSGKLAESVNRSLRYWNRGRSQWVYGPTGSGKDALFSALCAWTRTPSVLFPVNPDVDLMAWFYDKTFDENGTDWQFGELFNALVHGYTSPTTGRQIPMAIVLSDFDRASRTQAEALRLITDSIQGRIKGPNGETYPILPGTKIVVTANTMGGGDPTGRYVSAQVLDTSIIGRIERKVRYFPLEWSDEERIIAAKFPRFCTEYAEYLPNLGKCVKALRKAVEDESLYGEFSHRDLCSWIQDCQDIQEQYKSRGKTPPKNILCQGFSSYADGLPDEETRNHACSLIDPHLPDGALPRGEVPEGFEGAELDEWVKQSREGFVV
jgi:hypothetical protein